MDAELCGWESEGKRQLEDISFKSHPITGHKGPERE
jgi:hypothetical protein